jgi:hypothetical protein
LLPAKTSGGQKPDSFTTLNSSTKLMTIVGGWKSISENLFIGRNEGLVIGNETKVPIWCRPNPFSVLLNKRVLPPPQRPEQRNSYITIALSCVELKYGTEKV